MAVYSYSVLLLLLILILFTALLYVFTQRLRRCFFGFLFVQYLEQVNSFIIETRTFFVTSDVALISAFEAMLLKNTFMYEKFFNSKAIS